MSCRTVAVDLCGEVEGEDDATNLGCSVATGT